MQALKTLWLIALIGQADCQGGGGASTGGGGIATGSGSTGGVGGSSPTGTGGPGGTISGGSTGPGGATGGSSSGARPSPEVLLVNTVLSSYPSKALSRPWDTDVQINATILLTITNYGGIDDLNQLMSFSGIVTMKWNDSYITWNQNRNAGITMIQLRNKDIWLPLVIQSNDPNGMRPLISAKENMNSERVWAYYNGTVVAARADEFVAKCDLDLSEFPFDTQSCDFTFQGWNYGYYDMQILPAEPYSYIAQSSALYSPEWVISNISAANQAVKFDNDYYSCLTFTITATRRSYYYVMNVLLPCILMAILALTTFLFPMDTSRAGFAITVVLAFAIFQTLVVSALPKTSDQISLVLYIVCQMFIGGFITLYSICISWLVNKYAMPGKPMPAFLGMFCCRQTTKRHRGKTYGQMMEITKTSASPEMTHAALMIINRLDKHAYKKRCQDDWLHFFNRIDVLALLICTAASIIVPYLIFETNLFKTETKTAPANVQVANATRATVAKGQQPSQAFAGPSGGGSTGGPIPGGSSGGTSTNTGPGGTTSGGGPGSGATSGGSGPGTGGGSGTGGGGPMG